MTRRVNIYDEALVLVAAMRITAGQVPHRDFYYIYGPAQPYLMAGLFKIFGTSALIGRVLDLIIKGIIVCTVFLVSSRYCTRRVARIVTAASLLWQFADNGVAADAVVAVSMFNLLGAAVLLPVFTQAISRRRLLIAGALAGLSTLYRYDAGMALFGIQIAVMVIATYLRRRRTGQPQAGLLLPALFCSLGFSAIVLIPLAYYVAHVPWADFAHDNILYPARYYRRSRGLPYPSINIHNIDSSTEYLPIGILFVALSLVFDRRHTLPAYSRADAPPATDQSWKGFVVIFGALTLLMYLKGVIRLHPMHMYLSVIPAMLVLAVLFQHRSALLRPMRLFVLFLTALFIVTLLRACWREVRALAEQHSSVPAYLVAELRHSVPPEDVAWCNTPGPLTRGMCFEPDADRVHVIDYIDAHTTPDQKLFVGLARHDKVFVTEQLIYFGTQRLPATKWSDFNPNLQNTAPIQHEIIGEFDRWAPPLIVIDSEFENMVPEPNESSKSTGVTLLDDYIHANYRPIETFGVMAIWKRMPQPQTAITP